MRTELPIPNRHHTAAQSRRSNDKDGILRNNHNSAATKRPSSNHGSSQIQIFWPKSLSSSSSTSEPSHAIIGWIRQGGPGELIAVVAGLSSLPLDLDLISTLEKFKPQDQKPSASLSPRIIGECFKYGSRKKDQSSNGDAKGKRKATEEEIKRAQSEDLLSTEKSKSDFWITAVLPDETNKLWWKRSSRVSIPSLKSLRIPSNLSSTPQRTKASPPPISRAISHSMSLVLYDPPKPDILQFLSLEPLQLSPSPESQSGISISDSSSSSSSKTEFKHEEMTPLQSKLEKSIALDPERWFEVTGGYREFGPGSGLRKAVELINETILLMRRLQNSKPRKRSSNQVKLDPRPSFPLRSILSLLELTQSSLRSSFIYVRGGKYSLLDVSAAARQLDARLIQLQLWPIRAARLRKLRKGRLAPISSLSSQYIGVWNGIWLVANDLILGYAMGWTMKNKSHQVSQFLTYLLLKITNDWVIQILAWLGDWPAGLKLNTELALFFGDMYQGMTEMWIKEGLSRLLPILPALIYSVGLTGQVLGLTMMISLIIDSLNVLTLHLTGFYSIGRTVYVFFLYVLDSLFNLFRGKKRNPLRNGRIDDASYELDQLLLGTIFFTLLTFLFPTVFVYYLTFAFYRLVIVISRIGLEFMMDFLNHLPLFAIMLRFKDPQRLPFGIELKPISSTITTPTSSTSTSFHCQDQAHLSPEGTITLDDRDRGEGVEKIESRTNERRSWKEGQVDLALSSKPLPHLSKSRKSGMMISTSEKSKRKVDFQSEAGVDDDALDLDGSRGKLTAIHAVCTCSNSDSGGFTSSSSPSLPSLSHNSNRDHVSDPLRVAVYEISNVPLSIPSLFSGYSIQGIASIPKLFFKVISGAFF